MNTPLKVTIVVTILLLSAFALSDVANAGPAPADHGSGTNAECAQYGCLYGHDRCHFTRDGQQCTTAHGIAHERLPDGPDGRYYIRVMYPAGYDPSRRPMWDQVARCESTYRWHIDSTFDGGLQFSPSTWRAYGGRQFGTYAYQATPEQQITVAERVLWRGHGQYAPQGRGAWPHCGRSLTAP